MASKKTNSIRNKQKHSNQYSTYTKVYQPYAFNHKKQAIVIMRSLKWLVKSLAQLIIAVAILLNLYIYNYDRFKKSTCKWPDQQAEIKLLAFGDPQIRGLYPATPKRMRIDINGNDYYLGHVYNVMTGRLKPTHIAVMGDLLSSQWIGDDEFFKRAERYKRRIFRHVDNDKALMINVSGNHDIGYAGEMTPARIDRYEKAFGKVNYVKEYDGWRLVVLNSLALDGPSYVQTYHEHTQFFLNDLKNRDFKGSTVLLTHVPLAKPHGVCKDGPAFIYYQHGTLYEQNHLSEGMSDLVLNSVFGKGNPYGGVIVTGHDHEGCESVYTWNEDEQKWHANKFDKTKYYENSVKEFTVRSMMGEFGGNTGIMSGSLLNNGTWEFDYNLCPFAVQHLWWVTQVFTLVSLIIIAGFMLFW